MRGLYLTSEWPGSLHSECIPAITLPGWLFGMAFWKVVLVLMISSPNVVDTCGCGESCESSRLGFRTVLTIVAVNIR